MQKPEIANCLILIIFNQNLRAFKFLHVDGLTMQKRFNANYIITMKRSQTNGVFSGSNSWAVSESEQG